ncbi:MAG: DNA mismatch repair endonuclease MutL [Anaerolineae bacterium]|nr:DNA mismatch repair endonuclease MutL [Anaerolineae bacterium]
MSIQVLPDALVARIAAGEVVERPSSAVKELVENAIDAGATEIRVECAEGGRRLLRITDNGQGIRADEVALAFTHHATSKLQQIEDLSNIHTLGFRGEALASIASVSQVSCVTRHKDEQSGTLLRIDNAKIVSEERIGRPPGTTMTIEHLFARVPARLKFLKSNQTERGHIDGIVTRYAMAYPHIRFILSHDGKLTFQSNGNGLLRDVLVEIYGVNAAAQMVPIVESGASRVGGQSISPLSTPHSPQVSGFAALPLFDHSNRTKITLFVNGRPVQDTKLAYAVIQAYHTLLMVGRFPVAVVMLQVPPEDVDVNVHPAKAEVRFRDADSAFSAVQRAVRRTLLDNMPVPEAPSVLKGVGSGRWGVGSESATDSPRVEADLGSIISPQPIAPETPQPALVGSEIWNRVGIAKQGEFETRQSQAPNYQLPITHYAPQLPALRILGQLALTYIIAEGPEGLYLIDQHAAHERVLFEKLLAERELGAVSSQALLDPAPMDIPADSAYLLEEQLPMLQDLGFEVDHFGGNTFLVRAVPALMQQDDIVAGRADAGVRAKATA